MSSAAVCSYKSRAACICISVAPHSVTREKYRQHGPRNSPLYCGVGPVRYWIGFFSVGFHGLACYVHNLDSDDSDMAKLIRWRWFLIHLWREAVCRSSWSFVYNSSRSLRLEFLLVCRVMAQICLVNESPLTHLRHDRHCHAFIRSRNQQPGARSRRLFESWQGLRAAKQMPSHNKWIPSKTG